MLGLYNWKMEKRLFYLRKNSSPELHTRASIHTSQFFRRKRLYTLLWWFKKHGNLSPRKWVILELLVTVRDLDAGKVILQKISANGKWFLNCCCQCRDLDAGIVILNRSYQCGDFDARKVISESLLLVRRLRRRYSDFFLNRYYQCGDFDAWKVILESV